MIGDVLISCILLEAIKERYPQAQLHYLIQEHTLAVVQNNPHVDHFVVTGATEQKKRSHFITLCNHVRRQKYDVVIDAYSKTSSAFLCLLSGAKIRSGYRKRYSSFMYSHPVQRIKAPRLGASLAIENRMHLLDCLDIKFTTRSPCIYLSDQETQDASTALSQHGIDSHKPLFMIGVLGSSRAKSLPDTYMAELLDMLLEAVPEAQLLFNYAPAQLPEARTILSLCSERTQKSVVFDLLGGSLREFLALTFHCDALIGNEGGAINMAKALGVATFALFSPALNKLNWHGENEGPRHTAVHLSDYIKFSQTAKDPVKATPQSEYMMFTPDLFEDDLLRFLELIAKERRTRTIVIDHADQ